VFYAAVVENSRRESEDEPSARSWNVSKAWHLRLSMNGAPTRWKNSVILLFLKSGSALSLHDVSKKDLNLGLSENLLGSIIWIQQRSWL